MKYIGHSSFILNFKFGWISVWGKLSKICARINLNNNLVGIVQILLENDKTLWVTYLSYFSNFVIKLQCVEIVF